MNRNGLLFSGLALIAIGTIGLVVTSLWPTSWPDPGGGMMGGRGMMHDGGMMGGRGMMNGDRPRSFSSNGERIYYTARGAGDDITASMGGMTMSSPTMSCVDCHGRDGRGGRVSMPMGTFTAHNITYKELTEEEKPPYTDELIKRAITKGLDHKGKRLSAMMPKWTMSDRDLDDLIDYLKTLD